MTCNNPKLDLVNMNADIKFGEFLLICSQDRGNRIMTDRMKKVNKECLLDTPHTVRVSEKTWQVIVQTSRP